MIKQTNRIAHLSMYDWPETGDALDRLWYAMQKKLNSSDVTAPLLLTRNKDTTSLWTDPHLLIGQTCGWPYANILRDHCVSFARIHYDIDDCPPGYYNSVYIGQRKKDIHYLENLDAFLSIDKIAINSDDSQSGFHVYQEITKRKSEEAIPKSKRLITGSHRSSINAVAEGKAQIAAIDTVCFEMARKYDPDIISNVSVLGRSIARPGLPIITSNIHAGLIPALLEALAFGIYNLSEEDKQALLIKGITPCKNSDYDDFF